MCFRYHHGPVICHKLCEGGYQNQRPSSSDRCHLHKQMPSHHCTIIVRPPSSRHNHHMPHVLTLTSLSAFGHLSFLFAPSFGRASSFAFLWAIHFLNVFWSWRWCCGHMTGSCFQHITYHELGYFFHLLPLSQNNGYTSIYEKWHKVVNLAHCYHWNPWLVSTTNWLLANQQMASDRTTN